MSLIFLAGLLLLAAAFAAVVRQGAASAGDPGIVLVARVTRLPGPALSVSYFETRWRPYRDASDRFFPGMRPVNSLDFVYAP